MKNLIERARLARKRLKLNLLLCGLAIGTLAGLVITAYRLGIVRAAELMGTFLLWAREEPSRALLYVGLMALLGVAAGLCLKLAPLISGSGIPQVCAQLAGRLKIRWQRVLPFKFLGGILTLGGGLTLGREGPSIQLGAAVGQALGDILRRPFGERRLLISCGGAAGLASAFNAPIAGLVFALEELHRNFSPVVLISAAASAFAGVLVSSWAVFGIRPVLEIPGMEALPFHHYWLLPVLGIVTGLSGVLFNFCILRGKVLYEMFFAKHWHGSPARKRNIWLLRGVIPFVAVALVCLAFPRLMGSGEPMIFLAAGAENPPLWEIAALYAAKLALLTLCFGSGLPGGIFFPMLVLGSLVGNAVGQAASQLGFLEPRYILALALIAMTGHFSAIVRSPLTSILLVSEMTGSFAYMFPLGVVAMVSYGVAEFCRSEPIYASLQKMLPLKARKKNWEG